MKKLWYVYTVEYYSATQSNKIGSFVDMWMDLESVTQSEISLKEKNIQIEKTYKYHVLMHICGI